LYRVQTTLFIHLLPVVRESSENYYNLQTFHKHKSGPVFQRFGPKSTATKALGRVFSQVCITVRGISNLHLHLHLFRSKRQRLATTNARTKWTGRQSLNVIHSGPHERWQSYSVTLNVAWQKLENMKIYFNCAVFFLSASGQGEKNYHGSYSGRCYHLRSCVHHLFEYERLIAGGNVSFSDSALADACR